MIVYLRHSSLHNQLCSAVGGHGTELPSLIGFHEVMEHSILHWLYKLYA